MQTTAVFPIIDGFNRINLFPLHYFFFDIFQANFLLVGTLSLISAGESFVSVSVYTDAVDDGIILLRVATSRSLWPKLK